MSEGKKKKKKFSSFDVLFSRATSPFLYGLKREEWPLILENAVAITWISNVTIRSHF